MRGGRPLSAITADELSEIVHLASKEYNSLIKRLGIETIGWGNDVIVHLSIQVALHATLRKLEADEFYARPWYRRLLP